MNMRDQEFASLQGGIQLTTPEDQIAAWETLWFLHPGQDGLEVGV